LPLPIRPENIVHFFRGVHGAVAITKEVLRQRTIEYNHWVEAFARNHDLPIEWAEKGVRGSEIRDLRFKGSQTFINIQEDLVGQTARNESLPKFSL